MTKVFAINTQHLMSDKPKNTNPTQEEKLKIKASKLSIVKAQQTVKK